MFLVLALSGWNVTAATNSEEQCRQLWCDRYEGEQNVFVAEIGATADCVTEGHVAVVTQAENWSEAIGESLQGGLIFKEKRGAIVLILRQAGDFRYWLRLNNVISAYRLPIDTYKYECRN